eukprot:Seg1939.8 transcript_id=Seg1939.8/GoldUCD/mRNA.D3Y31 product="hypothetical protein" protein_id=Seg1939.8/GoldUCD/D3Y31
MIRKNGWLTSVELEEIKRRVMEEENGTQRNLEVNMNNEEIESNQNGDEMYINNDDNIQRTREEHDEQSGGNTMPEITIMCDSEQATEAEQEMVRRIVEIRNEDSCDFKKVDRSKVDEETRKVNSVLQYIETKDISETNKLLKAVSIYVAEIIGDKE